MNLLLATDSYKAGHENLYAPGHDYTYLYLESRGGDFPATVFFGLQYYLLQYLMQGFTLEDVSEAETMWSLHFGRGDYFCPDSWRKMYNRYGGAFPLRIKAVPEGTIVPTKNVLMTVESTDPDFAWLPGWFETLLLKVWYPTTIATQSYYTRKDLKALFLVSTSNMAALDYAVHDFGYRGSTSEESAALAGAAHLLSFNGSDNMAAVLFAQKYYSELMAATSIPAEEHSTIMSFGGASGEQEAYQHLLDKYPTGMVACVSDTYDIQNAVHRYWCNSLADNVFQRNGKVVIRPDSGNFMEIVPDILSYLASNFPITINSGGYILLDPHVGVIQGDGMTRETICDLYREVVSRGYAAENLVTGSGGGLLQRVTRDTCAFAMKASQIGVNGKVMDVFKNPKNGPDKKSKAGHLSLIPSGDSFATVQGRHADDVLEIVYLDGKMRKIETFEEIRQRVRI